MKPSFLLAFVVFALGAGGAALWSAAWNPGKTTSPTTTAAAGGQPEITMRYRTLGNGAIVYEETVGEATAPEDISPAAGGGDLDDMYEKQGRSKAPTFRYDPLTQTYRRTGVDTGGKSRQDVINTNNQ